MDLLQKTQTEFTSSENLSVSESIEFNHTKTLARETTKAFVSDNSYNNLEKNKRVSGTTFSSVALTTPPSENDEILYQNKKYRVTDWRESQGRYVLNTVYKIYHTGKRVTIR